MGGQIEKDRVDTREWGESSSSNEDIHTCISAVEM